MLSALFPSCCHTPCPCAVPGLRSGSRQTPGFARRLDGVKNKSVLGKHDRLLMLTPPDGCLPAASLYQGKLSFRGVENNARLSLFADLVIAGIQFSFQLSYQRLTEADRTTLTQIALFEVRQFWQRGSGRVPKEKMTPI